MAETEQQMCFSCGENPATSHNGTVPLCEKCASLVKDSRGVKYAEPTKSHDD